MNSEYNSFSFIKNSLDNCVQHRFNGKTISDFEFWKNNMRIKLSKILGLDKMKPDIKNNEFIFKKDYKNYTLEKYVLNTLRNLKMPYYKLTPKNGCNKAVIAIHGHGSDGKEGLAGFEGESFKSNIVKFNYSYGYDFLNKGYTVYIPDLPGAGERMLGIYGDKRAECSDINNALISMGMCLQGIILSEMKILLDLISEKYEYIGCCGFSGGANCGIWLSAMDDRLSFCVISGFFHSFKDTLLYTNRCGCNFVPKLWEVADMGDLLAVAAPLDIYIETGKYDKLNGVRGIDGVLEQLEIANTAYAVFNKKLTINICDGEHKWFGSILDKI